MQLQPHAKEVAGTTSVRAQPAALLLDSMRRLGTWGRSPCAPTVLGSP